MTHDLESAYLGDAHLQSAYLGFAHLRGAHLDGANLTETTLGPANLRGVQGLTWEQIKVARVLGEDGETFIRHDREGDLAALKRLLPDYVIVPPDAATSAAPPDPSAAADTEVSAPLPE